MIKMTMSHTISLQIQPWSYSICPNILVDFLGRFNECKLHRSALSQHHREDRTVHYTLPQLDRTVPWDYYNYSVLELIQDSCRHIHTLNGSGKSILSLYSHYIRVSSYWDSLFLQELSLPYFGWPHSIRHKVRYGWKRHILLLLWDCSPEFHWCTAGTLDHLVGTGGLLPLPLCNSEFLQLFLSRLAECPGSWGRICSPSECR